AGYPARARRTPLELRNDRDAWTHERLAEGPGAAASPEPGAQCGRRQLPAAPLNARARVGDQVVETAHGCSGGASSPLRLTSFSSTFAAAPESIASRAFTTPAPRSS